MTELAPFVADPDFRLYVGDVREVLASLPDGSVDCCVTSPPYWGLRDYGTDGQIGLEATPELFVAEMVTVFREVRRVLADHGTCWVNLGDSYNAYNGNRGLSGSTLEGTDRPDARPKLPAGHGLTAGGLKPKDLVGIPWRVAFALQQDGWYLRSDIIWAKPNPMPESVTDRPTKAHEYVFLLSKGPRYFFDQEAVREGYKYDGRKVTSVKGGDGSIQHRNGERWPGIGKAHHDARKAVIPNFNGHDESEPMAINHAGRNVRTVWEIATQPYPDAHFATFPEALPERCIKAGCPEQVCGTCGKARERIVETASTYEERKALGYDKAQNMVVGGHPGHHNGLHPPGMTHDLTPKTRVDRGWSDCGHNNWRAGVVLDPVMGSGTTALVARRLGRKSVGVELNPEYAELAARRLQQLSLLAEDVA